MVKSFCKTRHSGSVEKLIEANAAIKFFRLCGIVLSSDAMAVRLRVVARNDIRMSGE